MATKSKMAIEVLLAGADAEGLVLQPYLLKTGGHLKLEGRA